MSTPHEVISDEFTWGEFEFMICQGSPAGFRVNHDGHTYPGWKFMDADKGPARLNTGRRLFLWHGGSRTAYSSEHNPRIPYDGVAVRLRRAYHITKPTDETDHAGYVISERTGEVGYIDDWVAPLSVFKLRKSAE